MNAINFMQQHGIEKARKVVEGAPKWAMSINFNNGMYYSRMEHKKGDTFLYDIKLLVESVDLVNCNGGLNGTKNTVKLFQSSLDIFLNGVCRHEHALQEILRDAKFLNGVCRHEHHEARHHH